MPRSTRVWIAAARTRANAATMRRAAGREERGDGVDCCIGRWWAGCGHSAYRNRATRGDCYRGVVATAPAAASPGKGEAASDRQIPRVGRPYRCPWSVVAVVAPTDRSPVAGWGKGSPGAVARGERGRARGGGGAPRWGADRGSGRPVPPAAASRGQRRLLPCHLAAFGGGCWTGPHDCRGQGPGFGGQADPGCGIVSARLSVTASSERTGR